MYEMYDLSDLGGDRNKDIVDEFRASVGELMGAVAPEPMTPPPQAGMNDLASLAGGTQPMNSPQSMGLSQTHMMPPADPTMMPPQMIGQPQQQPSQQMQDPMAQDPLSQSSPNPILMQTMAHLNISDKQREFLQSDSRVVALVCGIGFGKSFIASEKAAQLLINGAHVLVMSQSYKQLSVVLMQEIQERLRFHGVAFEYNKASMIISVPLTGGKIFGFSSDSIESCRGVTVDCAILDEAALFDKYCYEVVAGRLRRGIVPYQIFITTTPRGRENWVFDICQKPKTHYIHAKTTDNPFLPEAYIEQLLGDYEGGFKAQELMGEFIDMDANAQLVSIKDVRDAMSRTPYQSDEPAIGGLDVARFGDDSSCFVIRQGNRITYHKKMDGIPLNIQRRMVVDWVMEHDLETLVVDGSGVGGGLVDELKEALIPTGCKIIEFNGSFNAREAHKFANIRAETWWMMKEWIEEHGQLPDDPMSTEIASINYLEDAKGRILMESKDMLRRQGKKSPDLGDAISMTFGSHAKKKSNADKIKQSLMGRRGSQGGFAVFAG